MSSFREFMHLSEAMPNVRVGLSGKGHYAGRLNLPDMTGMYQQGQRPPGGFQNFGQMAQWSGDRETLYLQQVLTVVGQVANNIAEVLDNQQKQLPNAVDYQGAYITPDNNTIGGIQPKLLQGQNAERHHLDPTQLNLAMSKGIITKDKQNANLFAINLVKLRSEMLTMQSAYQGQQQKTWAGGVVDQAFDKASSGGFIKNRPGVNPMGR